MKKKAPVKKNLKAPPKKLSAKPSQTTVPKKSDKKVKPAKASGKKTKNPEDEEAGLDDIMASLSKIFGGKQFLSDEDLDAFLDTKTASGEIPPSAMLDPLDEAQSLIYEAWNTEGPARVQLARQALEISEDCADAYLILANEDAKALPAALELYRKAFETAKRTLDPEIFEEAQGMFWGVMETRPYMRTRLGLATCLLEMGKLVEATDHFRQMLMLNPNDNQGVRYFLIRCLLASAADEELGQLLAQFKSDSSPDIRYTHALWMFRREGQSKSAGTLLGKAIAANPHVPAYLLNRKKLPKVLPTEFSPGSVQEAESYASVGIEPWHQTLGAIEWLTAKVPLTPDRKN
jgi:tetratricopeptide (TPR) repeat protein